MNKSATVKISDLILDFRFYPRHKVNLQHINEIVLSLDAGEKLPSIVVDSKTMRVADGFHRIDAYKRLYGDNAKIPAILKTYKNDRELFLDAMELNSGHGCNLTSQDRARSVGIAESLGIETDKIAKALKVKISVITNDYENRRCTLKINIEEKEEEEKPKKPKTAKVKKDDMAKTIFIKRPIMWMAGQELSEEQAEIHKKLGGHYPSYYINQLIMLIDNGFLNPDDELLRQKLESLKDTITQYLHSFAIAA